MTSRELVYKTLNFESPPRAPRQLWTLPWADIHHKEALEQIRNDFLEDFVVCCVPFEKYPETSGDPYKIGNFTDEWGVIWENKQEGIVGEVKNPIVVEEDWEDFENIHIPVEQLTFQIKDANDFCKNTDKFVIAGACPRPFEQMQFLRGTENLYIDIALGNEGFKRSLAKMHDFYCELMFKWAKTDVDALNMMDDWGSQKSLLINPASWEEYFKPMYKDYIDIAHSHGKKIFMHSDGYTLEILPQLIELGLDAFNTQIFCMDIADLSPHAGRITFWGEIDRQQLLPFGTQDDIADAVKKVHKNLWKDGGCIAQCEFGPGAKPENVRKVFESWNIAVILP